MKNYLYAVAAREGSDIRLVLRVKYNPQSGFYVLVPHPERKWNAHLSYHLSGRQHLKTHGCQPLAAQQCQPLTAFRGTKHLGNFRVGDVGVICDPVKFTKVMEVQAEKLKVRDAVVAVVLVEPGCTPRPPQDLMLDDVVEEKVFDETNPHIVSGSARLVARCRRRKAIYKAMHPETKDVTPVACNRLIVRRCTMVTRERYTAKHADVRGDVRSPSGGSGLSTSKNPAPAWLHWTAGGAAPSSPLVTAALPGLG